MKSDNICSFLTAKKAILLNFTGNTYHWGCYGTSMELYHSLLERNYYVDLVSVATIHALSPTPERSSDFHNKEFFKKFYESNQALVSSLLHSDIIVVNGEGTLHRVTKNSLALLYIIFISKIYLNKKIFLINFSCFPNGDNSLPNSISNIYLDVLKYVDMIAPRDCITHKILLESGIESTQAFDCLPRFLQRYKLVNSHEPKGYILVAGGIYFSKQRVQFLENFIAYFLEKNVPVKFLCGAQFHPASDDLVLQKKLKENPKIEKLEIIQASSMLEWINEFKFASFFFSARFHHSIASLSLGTPFKFLSSHTPKINSAVETLGEDVEKYLVKEKMFDFLIDSAEQALAQSISFKSEKRVEKMLSLADKNFIGI